MTAVSVDYTHLWAHAARTGPIATQQANAHMFAPDVNDTTSLFSVQPGSGRPLPIVVQHSPILQFNPDSPEFGDDLSMDFRQRCVTQPPSPCSVGNSPSPRHSPLSASPFVGSAAIASAPSSQARSLRRVPVCIQFGVIDAHFYADMCYVDSANRGELPVMTDFMLRRTGSAIDSSTQQQLTADSIDACRHVVIYTARGTAESDAVMGLIGAAERAGKTGFVRTLAM